MKKELSLLRVGLAVLILGTVSVGRTQTTKSADYFPLTDGSTWKLNCKAGDTSVVLAGTVINSFNDGEATEATMEWSRPSLNIVYETEEYRATATEVDQVSGGPDGSNRYNPPMPVLKYPLTAGAKWTWKGSETQRGEDLDAESVSTVSGPVSIKTGAGTFQAMKIHSELKVGAANSKLNGHEDTYVAPGVGIVQMEAKIGPLQVIGKLASYKIKK